MKYKPFASNLNDLLCGQLLLVRGYFRLGERWH
jgi:hypothetical protein